MPSLPPVPDVEDDSGILSSSRISTNPKGTPHKIGCSTNLHASDGSSPYQSTPTVSHVQRSESTVSTVRPPPSAKNSACFAHSPASSSSRSTTFAFRDDTFYVSEIKPVPPDVSDDDYVGAASLELAKSKASIPVDYNPRAYLSEELDLIEAMKGVGRFHSSFQHQDRSAEVSSREGGARHVAIFIITKNYRFSCSCLNLFVENRQKLMTVLNR